VSLNISTSAREETPRHKHLLLPALADPRDPCHCRISCTSDHPMLSSPRWNIVADNARTLNSALGDTIRTSRERERERESLLSRYPNAIGDRGEAEEGLSTSRITHRCLWCWILRSLRSARSSTRERWSSETKSSSARRPARKRILGNAALFANSSVTRLSLSLSLLALRVAPVALEL